MADINKLRRLALDGDVFAILELLDRLEVHEQGRLNGTGSEREAALMARLEAAEKSDAESIAMYRRARAARDELLARIEEMEKGREAMLDCLNEWKALAKRWEKERNDLLAHIEEMKKQEPIGWVTEDYQADKSATTYNYEIAERWRNKGWPVSNLYALPGATKGETE